MWEDLITRINGLDTVLFAWAYAHECDFCHRIHNPEEDFFVLWFKGKLFGDSPHKRGDIALCPDCAKSLQELLNEMRDKFYKLADGEVVYLAKKLANVIK